MSGLFRRFQRKSWRRCQRPYQAAHQAAYQGAHHGFAYDGDLGADDVVRADPRTDDVRHLGWTRRR